MLVTDSVAVIGRSHTNTSFPLISKSWSKPSLPGGRYSLSALKKISRALAYPPSRVLPVLLARKSFTSVILSYKAEEPTSRVPLPSPCSAPSLSRKRRSIRKVDSTWKKVAWRTRSAGIPIPTIYIRKYFNRRIPICPVQPEQEFPEKCEP